MSDDQFDFREVLPFWKARSTIAAFLATIAVAMQLAGYSPDILPNPDMVLEAIAVGGYLWAYVERLLGTKRLALSE